MNTLIIIGYIMVGLYTGVRVTRGYAWNVSKAYSQYSPDGDDWLFAGIIGFITGAGWPLWYVGRRLWWIAINVTRASHSSALFDKLFPKQLAPVETLADRRERRRKEQEKAVRELRGRKAELS